MSCNASFSFPLKTLQQLPSSGRMEMTLMQSCNYTDGHLAGKKDMGHVKNNETRQKSYIRANEEP